MKDDELKTTDWNHEGTPAVIMGVAVTVYVLSNGQQIVCAPYDEFVADLKSAVATQS